MATTALTPTERMHSSRRRLARSRSSTVTVIAVTAAVLMSACASDEGGADVLAGGDYVAAMNAICAETDSRLADLPEPPEQISAVDWATEVARAFRSELTAAEGLVVDGSIRETHRTYTLTAADLVASYDELSTVLATSPDDIGDVSTEITELSLGRDDVAAELGLDECVRSAR